MPTIDAKVERFTPLADPSKPGHAKIKLEGRDEELVVATDKDLTKDFCNGYVWRFWVGCTIPDAPLATTMPKVRDMYAANEVGGAACLSNYQPPKPGVIASAGPDMFATFYPLALYTTAA
jgi:hypothetical protein